MYSGYLDASPTKHLHYVFVKAETDSESRPVVLWLNGGPGCSSLEGFFYEHGPLVVADAHAPPNINFDGSPSTNDPSHVLVRNPWSWSRAANVLYLEAPAGVGFSYSHAKADLTTGDNQTAADNYAALNAFFTKFASFQGNDFYVSGESYGGVYVPTLSLKIFEAGKAFKGNMRGYLVGNGVFDWEEAANTQVPFQYGHGMMSTALYNQIVTTCQGNYLNPSGPCQDLLAKVDGMDRDTNGYDIYRTCYQPKHAAAGTTAAAPPRTWTLTQTLAAFRAAHRGDMAPVYDWSRHKAGGSGRPNSKRLGESVPCINSVMGTAYLNQDAVKQALHVTAAPNPWSICSSEPYLNYTQDGVYSSMVALHKQMRKYNARVLVYNGDVDPGCNYLWAEASVAKLGLNVTAEWQPWVYTDATVGEQLGGFITKYSGDVAFATVHGAGHMSPQWRPEAVFNMLTAFLQHD